MSKKISVIDLIGSLSESERIYFKRNYSKKADNINVPIYIKLYDYYILNSHTDKGAVLKGVGEGLTTANYAYQHHYLYTKLMDCLIQYYYSDIKENELRYLLNRARILRMKGFIQEAINQVKMVIASAEEVEAYTVALDAYDLYRKLIGFHTNDININELKRVNQSFDRINIIQRRLLTIQEYYYLILMYRKVSHYHLTESDKVEIEHLYIQVNSLHVDEPKINTSRYYEHYKLNTLANILYILGRKGGSALAEINVTSWMKDEKMIITDSEQFLEAYYTAIYTSFHEHRLDYLKVLLNNECHRLIKNNTVLDYYYCLTYNARIRLYHKVADFEAVSATLNLVTSNIKSFESAVNSEILRTLLMSMSISYFVLSEYDKAYTYLKNALVYHKDSFRNDQISFAYLFLLLICCEMGDTILFDYQYHSSYNYYRQSALDYSLEMNMTKYLNKYYHAKGTTNKLNQLTAWQSYINSHDQEDDMRKLIKIFNFNRWITSKVEKRKYKDQVIKDING